uniref:Transporter n=1 Tax=Setaria digitata TaxID=48799 RepID=A0A915Q1J1_9BILA
MNYLSVSNNNNWQVALRNQIEETARRNSDHKRYAQVEDRTKEMDDIIVKLRELANTKPMEAARLQVQAVSILDETDRLITTAMPDAIHIPPYFKHSLNKIENARGGCQSTNKIMPEKTTTTMRFATFADEENNDDEENRSTACVSATAVRGNSGDHPLRLRLFCSCHDTLDDTKGDDVRDLWKTQFEFFLSLVGFMVGVGNMLRFPSVAYKYGGGAFLIPYFTCLTLFGLPIVFMHLSIGQYSGLSPSSAFRKLMPIASGIGWALVFLALPISIYYNIIVAWSIYYFWFSLKGFFVGSLPWSQCNPEWPKNTPCCLLSGPAECFLQPHAISSPEAYFHYEVLNRTVICSKSQLTMTNMTTVLLNATFSSIDISIASRNFTLGPLQSHLVVSLAFAWILVFLGVFNGIGSIGWAISVTSTLPYLLLGILLLRGISLPGATQGLIFFLKPEIEKIWSISIWKAAAEQVFYSLGIDAGAVISMASFSRYRNNIYRDAVAVVLIFSDTFTSILAGMVIFSFTGFIAQNQQRSIDEILQHDPLYVAFTIYPSATTFMDMGPLWATLFFGMLTLSAVDAQFAWIEMVVSSVVDQFNKTHRRTKTRVMIALCVLCFICGLPFTTRGGIFLFHSLENMNANWNSFSLRVNNFVMDVGEMLRLSISLKEVLKSENLSIEQINLFHRLKFFFGPTGGYIRWTLSLCSPCILLFLLIASIFNYQRVSMENSSLPLRYELIAWFTMVGPLIIVPCAALCTSYEIWRNRMPLLSAFDCIRWRHKNVAEGEDALVPKHNSIADPISRVASARRPNASLIDDVGYGTMVEMINEWAKKNAAALYDQFGGENNVESQQDGKRQSKEFLSSESSNQRSCTELTLFGAPPTVELPKKTNTVIYRPKKGEELRQQFSENNLSKSTKCDSSVPLIRHLRRISWSGIIKGSNKQLLQSLKRSTSAAELSLDQRNFEENMNVEPGSTSHTTSFHITSLFMQRMLQRYDSSDHHSLSSISITPIDFDLVRNHSNSTISNLDVSGRSSRCNLSALKRPEPVNAPSLSTQS